MDTAFPQDPGRGMRLPAGVSAESLRRASRRVLPAGALAAARDVTSARPGLPGNDDWREFTARLVSLVLWRALEVADTLCEEDDEDPEPEIFFTRLNAAWREEVADLTDAVLVVLSDSTKGTDIWHHGQFEDAVDRALVLLLTGPLPSPAAA